MDSKEITNTFRQRTTEVDQIIDRLKSKIVSSSSNDSELLKIVAEQREKLIVLELQNKDQKQAVEDLKSRLKAEDKLFYLLNDLKKENLALKSELAECSEMQNKVMKKNFTNLMEELERVKSEAEGRVHLLEDKNESLVREIEKLYGMKTELETQNGRLEEDAVGKEFINGLEGELDNIIREYERFRLESNACADNLMAENIILKKDLDLAMDNYRSEVELLRLNNEKLENIINEKNLKEHLFMEQNLILNRELAGLKELVNKMKNEIVDLKGSIRVYCRVRPLLSNTDRYSFLMDSNSVNIDGTKFIFDKIFDSSNTQDEIFQDVQFLVDSIFEGYNSCIFAYGQTGSGKTHTMEGPDDNIGIIPRSVDEIFRLCEIYHSQGWDTNLIVSYIEIYNESIKDLLSEPESGIKYEIKHENEATYIKNCRYVEIKSRDEAMALLKMANKHRSVGSTKCNDRSSRSHSVFTFTVSMFNPTINEKRKGTLNLIDLAGSERLGESGSEGVRLRETQNINKSLSALGNVMNALLRNESHIPFRNSKLTYLMQNYLGGRARVLMFVNVSPELRHFNETLCSLRFASNVSECKLGQANKNICKKV